MNSDRIKELQEQTGYPQSISVYKALLQVWNECQQEHNEQLRLHIVSQQRELLDWLSNEPDHNIRKSDIDEILQDFKYYQSNCG